MPTRRFRPPKRPVHRVCRYDGCRRHAITGHAFCGAHAATQEAAAFYQELDRAADYVEYAIEVVHPGEVERADAFHRFRRRRERGEFNHLLDRPVQRILMEAAKQQGLDFE